jgi:hypothetical protein
VYVKKLIDIKSKAYELKNADLWFSAFDEEKNVD